MKTDSDNQKRVRYVELDVLRIIAALSIVLFHYTFRGYAADNMSILYFPCLGSIFKYGYLAIYTFFMLSGYVVLYSANHKTFLEFCFSRFKRLYPSFWCAVILTSIMIYLWGEPRYHVNLKQIIVNLTMLNGYLHVKSVDGAYWFLYEILKFYFYISMVILLRQINKIYFLVFLWMLGLTVLSLFPIAGKISFFLMPKYAPFIISGMIFYFIKQKGWTYYNVALLVWTFILCSISLIHNTPHMVEHYKSNFSTVVILSIILINYAVFAASVSNYLKISKNNNYILTLSAATYPLYLIHQNVGYILFNHYGLHLNKYLILILTISMMVAIAIFVTLLIEPFIVVRLNQVYQKINSPTKRSS